MTVQVLEGDALHLLRAMDDCSVDAVVTDPPYGLSQHKPDAIANVLAAWVSGDRDATLDGKGFMGKAWDAFVPPPALWDEVLRVLKPGGHACVFAGSRTVDLMGLSLRLAGFELRDTVEWLYGSGFPKSLDVSKAIDKSAGEQRERVPYVGGIASGQNNYGGNGVIHVGTKVGPEAVTPAAREWEGWGTALKPAHEPVLVARKPLSGTVAGNVLEWGTGALNIDGCRVRMSESDRSATSRNGDYGPTSPGVVGFGNTEMRQPIHGEGRWPANVVLDSAAADALDQQSGVTISKSGGSSGTTFSAGVLGAPRQDARVGHDDSGGASRFFTRADYGPNDWPFLYCAKPSKRERNAGLDGLPLVDRGAPSQGMQNMDGGRDRMRHNHHPTVKPVALMRHLVRLVTPPGGTVLDPFTGSGTTLVAATHEHVNAIGCEIDPDYATIARARVSHAQGHTPEPDVPEPAAGGQHPTLPGV